MRPVVVRIINLAARADRREHVVAQLADAGVTQYEFFEAIDGGRHPDHPLFRLYDPVARTHVKGPGRDLKPSQLGCYASHYLLWQECLAAGAPMIVMEDDAILLPGFGELLACARELADRWPLVWLHDADKPRHDAVLRVGHVGRFALYKTLKSHYRTVAYLISPAGARGLLGYSRTWVYPVDDAMCRFYDHGVESILIRPHCVTHDNGSASDITGFVAASMPLHDRLRRARIEAFDHVRRALYNVRFRVCLRFRSR